MNRTARQVAAIAIAVLTAGLLITAWNGYREAAWLLLLDALPLCG